MPYGPSHALAAVLDGLGSFVFALSGGLLAVQKEFDLFGVLVLSFVVAVAGGVLRDVLIGALPPAAIVSWHALAIAVTAGMLTFLVDPIVERHRRNILLADAIGLGLFAVTGTQKALNYGINPPMAAVLGMVSGIGGGMLRDVLAGEVPTVLRADLYALAALAGAAVVAAGWLLGAAPLVPMLLGAAVCLFLRLMAICFGWRVPVARLPTAAGRTTRDRR